MLTRAICGAAVVSLLVSTAAFAGWRQEASAFDAQRLSRLQESKAKGLQEASAGPDMATIHEVLGPRSNPIGEREALGDWHCRTIKLGGMTPSKVYSWFHCRVSHRGGGLYLEKLTGSDRVNGYLYPDRSGGLVLLGANTVTGEPERHYSGDGASVGAAATPDDAVGVMTSIGPGHARVEFPYPVQESTFDVLELKR
ncbi:MAG: DUF4893 domain-containing protein [Rhizomicrobium sp.]